MAGDGARGRESWRQHWPWGRCEGLRGPAQGKAGTQRESWTQPVPAALPHSVCREQQSAGAAPTPGREGLLGREHPPTLASGPHWTDIVKSKGVGEGQAFPFVQKTLSGSQLPGDRRSEATILTTSGTQWRHCLSFPSSLSTVQAVLPSTPCLPLGHHPPHQRGGGWLGGSQTKVSKSVA